MMVSENKVAAMHLARKAYLYVRQSSLRQVMINTESTKRQYDMRRRAIALGWPQDQIVVIDCDLGKSGASSAGRAGFQRLVGDVGLGKAGIVMGLEVSRLARNNADWQRLLEICALTETLLLDEDGIYDPSHFNDRLLLGLKGTMSEAELHMLRLRLRGGILNKARRGELEMRLPIGLIHDPARDRVILNPDKRIRESVQLVFDTFARTGSAMATVKYFREQGLQFPRRIRRGSSKGEVIWGRLQHTHVLRILHNPRYSGAFVFGRTRTHKLADGRTKIETLPQDQWTVLLRESHEGFISWETFENNEKQLRANAQSHGMNRRHGPPREGPALLQGLVICGKCGRRMTVRYHRRRDRLDPEYICQVEGIAHGKPKCAFIPGSSIDKAIGAILLETVTPVALEVSLAVQEELTMRVDEADALRKKGVEQARYEAEISRRRYMRVDPDNRLVADELEAVWNEKLRLLVKAQEEYERKCEEQQLTFDAEKRRQILSLATDFPRIWSDPATLPRDKKRMIRLLIEDVTLRKEDKLIVQIRFRGGATKTLDLPRPTHVGKIRKTTRAIIDDVDRLLDSKTCGEIAQILNDQGRGTGEGKPYRTRMVIKICKTYQIKSRFQRLSEAGLLNIDEVAKILGVSASTTKTWKNAGLLRYEIYNDKGECLFYPPGSSAPIKHACKGIAKAERARSQVRSSQ